MASSEEFLSIDSSEVEVGEKRENSQNDIQKCLSKCQAFEGKRSFLLWRIARTLLKHQNVHLSSYSSYRGTLSEMF